MSRFTPFTYDAAGRAEEREHRRDLARRDRAPGHLPDVPVDDLVARRSARNSGSSGVSIGPGHTAFVRTPRRIVGRDERIVYSSTTSFEKLYGALAERRPCSLEPLQRRGPPVGDVEVEQLVDLLGPLAPQVAGGRRGVDDRAALGHAVEQALRQRAQREVVHRRARSAAAGVSATPALLNSACTGSGSIDRVDRVAHGVLVGQVGRDERVVRAARRVEVEHGDVRDVELGEHVEQRRADTARAARDDDAAVLDS